MSSSEPTPEDPYSTITVDEVSFTGDTGPVSAEGIPDFAFHSSLDLDFSTEDAFVVGIHAIDPPIGSGDPRSLDSLIGFKILPTGEFRDIEVPIFPYFDSFPVRPGQVFPPTPDETTTIEGTLWHDINQAIGTTPSIIEIDGEINAKADITDLDQNPSRDPIGVAPVGTDWNFVGGRVPDTFAVGDNPRFGEAVDAVGDVVAGAPLEDHSTNVGSTYVLNGIFEELEPDVAGIGEDQIEEGAQFGSSVAIDGPIIAVGAPNDDGGSGAVYIFVPNESSQPQLLTKISGDSPGNDLGAAVDVTAAESDGNFLFRVLSGAPNAGTGGKIKIIDIQPPETEDGNPSIKGQFSLSPAGLGQNAEFGSSIGTLSLIESEPESPALIGAPGATSDGADNAGKAYLYQTVTDSASPEELTATSIDADARFGSDVGLSVDDKDLLLAVGAPGSSDGQGEASLFDVQDFFTESPDSPEREETFDDPDSSPGDRLGAAVALTDNQNLVAGAPGGGYATLFDEGGIFSNVAGHFTRPGDVPSFGASVATGPGLGPDQIVIGAPEADSVGRVYIYELPEDKSDPILT